MKLTKGDLDPDVYLFQNIHNKIIPCSPCPNTSAYDTVEFGVELAPL